MTKFWNGKRVDAIESALISRNSVKKIRRLAFCTKKTL